MDDEAERSTTGAAVIAFIAIMRTMRLCLSRFSSTLLEEGAFVIKMDQISRRIAACCRTVHVCGYFPYMEPANCHSMHDCDISASFPVPAGKSGLRLKYMTVMLPRRFRRITAQSYRSRVLA
eukprot:6214808-Pleurochrysis_carterae.AAC.2